MFTRIIVPLDGSELAEQALPQAEELARLTNAPIHLVRIIDVGNPGQYGAYLALEAAGYAEALERDEAETETYLEAMGRRLADRGHSVAVEHQRGHPAQELVALTRPDDLIVMATHGRGGVGRALLGSVADEVVRHARVPVLLVRASAEQGARPQPAEKPITAVGYEPW